MDKAQIIEVVIRHEEELAQLLGFISEFRENNLAAQAKALKEFSDVASAQNAEALEQKTARLRAIHLRDSAEKLAATITEQHARAVAELAALKADVATGASHAVKAEGKRLEDQLTAACALMDEHLAQLTQKFQTMAQELPAKLRQFAKDAAINGDGSDFSRPLISAYKGQLTPESVFKPGDIWTYRGGTYFALKGGRGDMPTRDNQRAPNPIWALWAAPGAPAAPTSANPIGATTISPGTVPANSSSAGTAGNVAFDGNYFYVCTATNTWRRFALDDWA